MKHYVLGFAFDMDNCLALIKKKRPDWQAGLWNGIGGLHDRDGELTSDAMSREFHEETGVLIPSDKWIHRGILLGDKWSVYVFTVRDKEVSRVQTCTDEEVRLYTQTELMHREDQMIENLPSLIELCLMKRGHSGCIPKFILDYL